MYSSATPSAASRALSVFVFILLLLGGATPAFAQSGTLRVSVAGPDDQPLEGATVRVSGTDIGAVTGPDGGATLTNVPAGRRTLTASLLGYRQERVAVTVDPDDVTDVSLTLRIAPVEMSGIEVSVLRPDQRPEVQLEEAAFQEANPHDVGAAMRGLPGLDAIRRGGLGLDPVVRGLRDTQVGAYVDGMRTLPGGPGGMDTPLSHVDPSAVKGMEVMKGPYALTWGAGNMSAIRVETQGLPPRDAEPVSGRLRVGHDSNLSATEASLELDGAAAGVSYAASGAWRQGADYTSGAGDVTAGDFTSGELRGRFGFSTGATSTLTLSGWYQDQRDIDYPGRPMNADFFETYNGSARWEHRPESGVLESLEAMAYVYAVDHAMNNDGKPTARPDPDRTPPFPMDMVTVASNEMTGGRLAAELAPGGGWSLELGADGYTALHDASGTMANRDTDMLMMERVIWGGARITSLGAFASADRPLGPFTASGTVRVDRVEADADSASAFFLENASAELSSSESNLSGAFTMTLPVTSNWSASGGVGSVVRTADANERFSDRSPSKRAQIGAEFLGDPGIRPERSTQVDLWVDANYERWTGSLNLFWQRIDDAVTIEATDLPKRSAMSAPTVFRYVNGDARYRGIEASGRIAVNDAVTFSASTAYLWGEDVTLDEPALGVSPWRGDLGVRWDPMADGAFVEVTGRIVADQERVSSTRGEVSTPGYRTADVQAGLPLPRGVTARVGVTNLFDEAYANHLNARNPFTGFAVPEPGRVFFARVSVPF
ncbi:MAG: TonB-dependent receptor domain-containing protein [Gemmatimonadota bacterium]